MGATWGSRGILGSSYLTPDAAFEGTLLVGVLQILTRELEGEKEQILQGWKLLKKSRFHTDEAPAKEKEAFRRAACFSSSRLTASSKPCQQGFGEGIQNKKNGQDCFLFANANIGNAGKGRRKPRSELGRMRTDALNGPLAGKPYQSSKRGKMCVQVSASPCSLMQRIQDRFVVSAWQARLRRGRSRPNEFILQAADILLHRDTLASRPYQACNLSACRACMPAT
jgi:hypothetical protein